MSEALTAPAVVKSPPLKVRVPSVKVALEVTKSALRVPASKVEVPSDNVEPLTKPLPVNMDTVNDGFVGRGRLVTPVKLPLEIVMVPSVKVVKRTTPDDVMLEAVTEPLVEM